MSCNRYSLSGDNRHADGAAAKAEGAAAKRKAKVARWIDNLIPESIGAARDFNILVSRAHTGFCSWTRALSASIANFALSPVAINAGSSTTEAMKARAGGDHRTRKVKPEPERAFIRPT